MNKKSKIVNLVYRTKDRDITKFLKRSIKKNRKNIGDAYNDNADITELTGTSVKKYLHSIIALLDKVYDEVFFNDFFCPNANSFWRLSKNLKILSLIKDNAKIVGWSRNKPKFSKLLNLDIDKETGMPLYGDLKGLIDNVAACQDFNQSEIDRFFSGWVSESEPRKLTQSDYIKLLVMSNRKSLSEVDIEGLQEFEDYGMKIDFDRSGEMIVKSYRYNDGNGFEFVTLNFESDRIFNKGKLINLIKKKPVVVQSDKKGVKISCDQKFKDLFKNIIINDARFFHKQLQTFLDKEYGIKMFVTVKMLSIGLKTPYNNLNKELFPELEYKCNDDYYVVVRKQDFSEINDAKVKDEAKYVVVK